MNIAIKKLHEIEATARLMPRVTTSEALTILNLDMEFSENDQVKNLVEEHKIFAFFFDKEDEALIPLFQFDRSSGGLKPIAERLFTILSGMNDWGVCHWLCTISEDLGCTPVEAVDRPELHDDLMFLAGLFKSQSTFSYL